MNKEERLQILKMIETGKVTADEGLKLLEAIESHTAAEEEPVRERKASSGKKRKFCIKVYEGDLEKPKVNVSIPFGLAEMAAKIIPSSVKAKLDADGHEIDLGKILEQVKCYDEETLLEVNEEGEKTKVIIALDKGE